MSKKNAPNTNAAKRESHRQHASSERRRRAGQPLDAAALSDAELDAVSGGAKTGSDTVAVTRAFARAALNLLR
jgi:hypothetical protein